MLGRDELILGLADRRRHLIGREVEQITTDFVERAGQGVTTVRRVVNGVVLFQTNQSCVLSQQPSTKPMKRTDPNRLPRSQLFHTTPHLVRRFIRERQRQDIAGCNAVSQQVRHAVRNDTGFSATWTRQNEHRSIEMFDRFSLDRRQRIQTVIDIRFPIAHGVNPIHKNEGEMPVVVNWGGLEAYLNSDSF
jgi:hypothetical protein